MNPFTDAVVECPLHAIPSPSQPSCPHQSAWRHSYAHEPAQVSTQEHGLLAEAKAFLEQLVQEQRLSKSAFADRIDQIQTEIAETGTYWQTPEELAYGAKLAWRNSNRCIGRIYWRTLRVHDMRHLTTAEEVFEALVEHLQYATNGGNIHNVVSLFRAAGPDGTGIRIWNPLLIRYAGYRQPDGSIVGDPSTVEFTQAVQQLGWPGGAGTPFDLLPIVIQMPGESPQLFELLPAHVQEVPIEHPAYPWFAGLGLKWNTVPAISNMCLEIGGISYTAAPFNGWYLGVEIAARNFGDKTRYNMLPTIAQKMALDTSSPATLWQDRAMIELNIAVLHSFKQQGVKILDHHTATDYFVHHEEQEAKAGRKTPAEWSWIVPPISGSITPVFHRSYENFIQKPNFFYQPDPWKNASPAI